MPQENSVLRTGVDKLVELIRQKKRISVPDAAKALGVGSIVVEEWADFLEEEGIISIEYKFATPYLIERQLTRDEIKGKEKEFHSSKEGFVRKAEVVLSAIDRDGDQFKSFRANFDKIKKDLGGELEKVEDELKELEKYESLKNNIDSEISSQEKKFIERFDNYEKEIAREQDKYKDLLEDIGKEEDGLDKERAEAMSLREKELSIKSRLDVFQDDIGKIKNSLKDEEAYIGNSENRIRGLKKLAEKVKKDMAAKKTIGDQLVRESGSYREKIAAIQREILQKVSRSQTEIAKKISEGKTSTAKFREFFNKKAEIETLINEMDKQKDSLEYELINLIKKAKAFHLSANSSELSSHTKELEKTFETLVKKKQKFEEEARRLGSLAKED